MASNVTLPGVVIFSQLPNVALEKATVAIVDSVTSWHVLAKPNDMYEPFQVQLEGHLKSDTVAML